MKAGTVGGFKDGDAYVVRKGKFLSPQAKRFIEALESLSDRKPQGG